MAKKDKFNYFDAFEEQVDIASEEAEVLIEAIENFKSAEDLKELLEKAHEIEKRGDDVNHKIRVSVAADFITPIDREDIYALANGLDDGVDYLQGTLQRIVMYRTGKAMSGAVTMTKLLIEATEQTIRAFSLLKDIRKNQAAILDATHKIAQIESEGDRVYRHEIAYLFDKEKDPIELIKWKDILEKLEDTLDHCEKLSDMIRGVVMKYA
jgi:uncharacterized protein Yka (UPF0111/DUF47 family)